MILSPLPRQRFFDVNGVPLAGGLLYTYAAGTTTPQGTYSDSSGTTNTNPVVLDAYGYANVWLNYTLAYKFVLEDVNGNVQWTVDNINSSAALASGILTSNTLPASVTVVSGNTLMWPTLTIPSGLTLTVSSGGYFTGIHPVTVASGGTLTINSGGVATII